MTNQGWVYLLFKGYYGFIWFCFIFSAVLLYLCGYVCVCVYLVYCRHLLHNPLQVISFDGVYWYYKLLKLNYLVLILIWTVSRQPRNPTADIFDCLFFWVYSLFSNHNWIWVWSFKNLKNLSCLIEWFWLCSLKEVALYYWRLIAYLIRLTGGLQA